MPLIHLCFLFRLSSHHNSAPPPSFSHFACILTWNKPPTFFPPSCTITHFHLLSNNFHLSDFIQLQCIQGLEWRPLSSPRLNAVHGRCTRWTRFLFERVQSNWIYFWLRVWRANKKQVDRTKFVWDEDLTANTANCEVKVRHSVILLFMQTCSSRILSWKAEAA